MPHGVAKADLPTKTCPVCQRPFAWRKKWARDWESVVYCSDRCRAGRRLRSDDGRCAHDIVEADIPE